MKVAITGHKGFVGTNLKKHLKDHELLLFEGRLEDKYCFVDIQNADVVVHLAGKNKGAESELVEANVFGTLNLIKWATRKAIPLIIAGSDYKKDDTYKFTKDSIKNLCKIYSYRGLNSTILDMPKVIGPHCKPHYNSFVTTLIHIAAQGKLNQYLYLIKDMTEMVELIHVDGVCNAIEDLMQDIHPGYVEYQFNELDGVFKLNFHDIIESIEGRPAEELWECIPKLVQWYKENQI